MQRKSTLRSSASSLIRKHRWLPAISTLACAFAFGIAMVRGAHSSEALGTAAALAFAAYVWGYSARAFKVINYPSLLNLPRRQPGRLPADTRVRARFGVRRRGP